jgi:hypothetical protein
VGATRRKFAPRANTVPAIFSPVDRIPRNQIPGALIVSFNEPYPIQELAYPVFHRQADRST